MKYFYTDSDTIEFLNSDKPRVYIYGGNTGYMNFGDIIQQKSAMWFWRQHTDIEPVVVFRLGALEHHSYIEKAKNWYECEHIIYEQGELLDVSNTGLEPMQKVMSGGLLHVYGGGFLNKYWGKSMINGIVDIIEMFGVSDYVFSGQQVDKEIIPYLDEALLSKKMPLLFGVRDRISLDNIKTSKASSVSRYSFDDVTEVFEAWKQHTEASPRVRLLNKLRPKSVMWHMNISYYSSAQHEVLHRLRSVGRKYQKLRPLVVQSFNEMRVSTRDSLQSLALLEDKFPYDEYRVVNIANYSLKIKPFEGIYPNISNLMDGVAMTIASSYHTAMLSSFFGVPTYLASDNEFYSQKQKALGLEPDFEKFLKNPACSLNHFEKEKAERRAWLDELVTAIETAQKDVIFKPKILHKQLDAEGLPKFKYRTPNS